MTTSEALQKLIHEMTTTLRNECRSGQLDGAEEADRRANSLAGSSGLEVDSPEYLELAAALCEVAGREFPGDWDGEASLGEPPTS